MPITPPIVWRAFPEHQQWRAWDDDYVVFDSRSGQVHLLSSLAAAVLSSLDDGPADVTEIRARVASTLESAPPDTLDGQIGELVLQLDALGLAEPVGE